MSDKLPITVLIPTINAEGHMEELLDSIQAYVEDIFIVDSLSIDHTVDIALKRGVKILQRPFKTSSDQFSWMLRELPVKTPWIFFMAQDERMSEGLRNELQKTLSQDDGSFDGYTVRWRLWFMGKPLHAAPAIPRIFRTGMVDVTDVTCNEHFVVKSGKIGQIDGILEHKDTLTMHDWYEKENLYTSREAIGIVTGKARTEKPNLFGNHNERVYFCWMLLMRLPGGCFLIFWYYFLCFGAWKDGTRGILWAKLRVWVKKTTMLKVREMHRTKQLYTMPHARFGKFDSRIMQSELEKKMLPELVEEWAKSIV